MLINILSDLIYVTHTKDQHITASISNANLKHFETFKNNLKIKFLLKFYYY